MAFGPFRHRAWLWFRGDWSLGSRGGSLEGLLEAVLGPLWNAGRASIASMTSTESSVLTRTAVSISGGDGSRKKPITEVDRLNRHAPGHRPPWSPSRHLNGTEWQKTNGFAFGRLHVFIEKKITEVAPFPLKNITEVIPRRAVENVRICDSCGNRLRRSACGRCRFWHSAELISMFFCTSGRSFAR